VRVGGAHLTYCTNIHAGESWSEVRANLERYVVAVKQRVCPDAPFGVGLRLSERAARELAVPAALAELQRFLDTRGLYVFTINGFPYGAFHATRVKEQVYRPDWLERDRVAYTCLLAELLGQLQPPGVIGSISTVPGCFRARGNDARAIVEHLKACGDALARANVVLALEPEPACLLETLDEAFAFVDDHRLADARIGVCVDACHAAVEFDDLAQLARRPRPTKIQLSCGLAAVPVDAAARAELARFAEDVYLHQVVARGDDGTLARYLDLPEALADRDAPTAEWRVHFHVPIFRAALGAFTSTQPYLAELLAMRELVSTHLEVETYTWDVLPPELRGEPVEDAIARELRWVLERIA
jgi:sugar phosphate isomerase/epimerase